MKMVEKLEKWFFEKKEIVNHNPLLDEFSKTYPLLKYDSKNNINIFIHSDSLLTIKLNDKISDFKYRSTCIQLNIKKIEL